MTDPASSPRPIPARALYPIKEAQRLLSVSHAGLYRIIKNGGLDARKIGSRTLITAESIETFLSSLPKVGEAARGRP